MVTTRNKIKIVHFSRFKLADSGDGGTRRTQQIHSLLHGFDVDFVTSSDLRTDVLNHFPFPITNRNFIQKLFTPFLYLYCILTKNNCFEWSDHRRDEFLFMRIIARRWAKTFNFSTYQLAIVDDPIYFLPLIKRLKQLKLPVVGLCHNIESLSKPQILDKYQLKILNDELQLFSLCELVVTISREEDFLLTNMGIPTLFLPYRPSEYVVKRMAVTNKARETSYKSDLVLVGSVGNPPTLQGMHKILTTWTSKRRHNKIIICGYGTEQLKRYENSDSVEVRGSLTDEELDELLVSVRGALIYQQEGSGALTKISELLLAGVPIFANSLAARTYYNLPGIMEFNSIERLLDVADEYTDMQLPIEDYELALQEKLSVLTNKTKRL